MTLAEPTHDEIAKQAYRIWQDEGSRMTSQDEADDNWFEAEAMIELQQRG